ncbi:hypothetical protein [Sulfobacillus thermosulfidooxidans]|uniref:hypothetical protein n=1 Tax=Sulfobacillus thermosulfidooxidans TaxID=28034 RepID=UPI0006B436D0|nr:hypothetical protein [Sulfobacillus thermosulfidooxidans]
MAESKEKHPHDKNGTQSPEDLVETFIRLTQSEDSTIVSQVQLAKAAREMGQKLRKEKPTHELWEGNPSLWLNLHHKK